MKNIDSITLYIGLIVEIIMMFLFRYLNYLYLFQPIIISSGNIQKNPNIKYNRMICLNLRLFFYILILIYIITIIHKYHNYIYINLKKNTSVLLIIVIIDFACSLFDLQILIMYSNALRFVIICLLTNLVVYIKYKKNNIKIK